MIIRKTFKAELAHRVRDAYTTRCRGLHGHSYTFEVYLQGDTQDKAEMLCDFKLVKDKLNGFLDAFDHSLVVEDTDTYLKDSAEYLNERFIIVPYNPTAEQMARHIYQQASEFFNIEKVIVHETLTGCAIYNGDDNIKIDLLKVKYSRAVKWI